MLRYSVCSLLYFLKVLNIFTFFLKFGTDVVLRTFAVRGYMYRILHINLPWPKNLTLPICDIYSQLILCDHSQAWYTSQAWRIWQSAKGGRVFVTTRYRPWYDLCFTVHGQIWKVRYKWLILGRNNEIWKYNLQIFRPVYSYMIIFIPPLLPWQFFSIACLLKPKSKPHIPQCSEQHTSFLTSFYLLKHAISSFYVLKHAIFIKLLSFNQQYIQKWKLCNEIFMSTSWKN